MSRNLLKSKRSTSKYRKFRISPLIPIVAIIEVVALIGVSTFAWFVYFSNKKVSTGNISVEADSGLDIDFAYQNEEEFINIWNYIDDDFTFEPVTSLDGRNVFIPTSGNFNNVDTNSMVFREGTVNDINSKYINVDFELTNTTQYNMDVYLNNNSFFRVKDSGGNLDESRALRLAFYTNDGNAGNVGSSLIRGTNTASDGGDTVSSSKDTNAFTVYFDNSNVKWPSVYAHFWNDNGTSSDNSDDVANATWPGIQMSRISGSTYMITISNPLLNKGTENERLTFNSVIFSNNGSETQRVEFSTSNGNGLTKSKNGYIFKKESNYTPEKFETNTVYFIKPTSWTTDIEGNDGIPDLYCAAFDNSTPKVSYTSGNGDKMTYVGAGIYSYTYNASQTGEILISNLSTLANNNHQTVDFTPQNNRIFYASGINTGGDSSNNKKMTVAQVTRGSDSLHFDAESEDDSLQMKFKTLYFYNTYGWSIPYCLATRTSDSINSCEIPMTSLSGNVYYCTVPEFYDKVQFHKKGSTSQNDKTVEKTSSDGTVYRPDEITGSGYETKDYIYSDYTKETGYPVISPGVSVGFQRSYSPVVSINASTGIATEIIPAFANSVDDYIYSGTGSKIFTIEANHMVSLSLVIWLEGTDLATFDKTYPGNNIELNLEFATVTKDGSNDGNGTPFNLGDSDNYTYRFVDATRELWTSDRQATESGVTVAPVMQLYDCTIGRGYLMEPVSYGSYGGKAKVSTWEVEAPPSIALLGHDIEFRRVNPYNESEVWNYWHPGRVAGSESDPVYRTKADRAKLNGSDYTVYAQAKSGSGEDIVISFTAFADGSPTDEMLQNNDGSYTAGSAGVPSVSCGGLWGDYSNSVRTLTVLDGTNDYWIRKNKGILNMSYSFTYSGGGKTRTVNIEYKSSVGHDTFYYFVVPSLLYSKSDNQAVVNDIKFKRYFNFNGSYAINSDRNNTLKYDQTFDAGTALGEYYEISQSVDNSIWKYWGSDVLYIQTAAAAKKWMVTDLYNEKMLRVHFYKGSDTFNVVLYPNWNFRPGGNDTTGYPVVVPNNKSYDHYVVQYVKSTDDSVVYYHGDTPLVYYSSVNDGSTISIRNTLYNISGASGQKSQHICNIDYFFDITLYFQSKLSEFNNAWNSNYEGRRVALNGSKPGWELKYVDTYDGFNRYKLEGISVDTYNWLFLHNSDWGGLNKINETSHLGFTPQNSDDICELYYDNGYKLKWVGTWNTQGGHDKTWAFHQDIVSADSTDWPHYSEK